VFVRTKQTSEEITRTVPTISRKREKESATNLGKERKFETSVRKLVALAARLVQQKMTPTLGTKAKIVTNTSRRIGTASVAKLETARRFMNGAPKLVVKRPISVNAPTKRWISMSLQFIHFYIALQSSGT